MLLKYNLKNRTKKYLRKQKFCKFSKSIWDRSKIYLLENVSLCNLYEYLHLILCYLCILEHFLDFSNDFLIIKCFINKF